MALARPSPLRLRLPADCTNEPNLAGQGGPRTKYANEANFGDAGRDGPRARTRGNRANKPIAPWKVSGEGLS
jgi:hypothetical protein